MRETKALISPPVLYLSILIIAVCGIIYELIIGSVSSYLWGDSIWYFSVTIGLYMSALGLGAYISKFIKNHLFDWFVLTEILVGLLGGISALFLFWVYAVTEWYEVFMVGITVAIGSLVGLEIPLLIRVLESRETLRKNVAHVLTYDYIGGLIGALAFPLLLLPVLGIVKTSILLGLSNLIVVLMNFWRHRHLLHWRSFMLSFTVVTAILLGYFMITSQHLSELIEQKLYHDRVVFNTQTPYQHLTLTQWHKDIRLFINGNLQFSSLDEYRYHESLVHVPLATVVSPRRILVLGGGDGLAIREILKYPSIEHISLIDIDPAMTQMAQKNPLLSRLNQNSLDNPKVKIVHMDAYKFVETDTQFYDAIIIDLPDPNHTALGKLYSQAFYQILKKRLSQQGVMVTQSTSPFFAKEAFWCIHKTMQTASWNVYAYHVDVPSFGDWGFQLASLRELQPEKLKLPDKIKPQLQFLTDDLLPTLFVFGQDAQIDLEDLEVNTMIHPVLLRYYQKGWENIR